MRLRGIGSGFVVVRLMPVPADHRPSRNGPPGLVVRSRGLACRHAGAGVPAGAGRRGARRPGPGVPQAASDVEGGAFSGASGARGGGSGAGRARSARYLSLVRWRWTRPARRASSSVARVRVFCLRRRWRPPGSSWFTWGSCERWLHSIVWRGDGPIGPITRLSREELFREPLGHLGAYAVRLPESGGRNEEKRDRPQWDHGRGRKAVGPITGPGCAVRWCARRLPWWRPRQDSNLRPRD